ncbi:hypothetical protein MUU75_04595 [Pseudoxanthomonas mexicana]|uniref:hypothetical protein n=1 Tax=Pseudoxanthomonas mexicana TaxID=128785 RepID=UPI001FD64364|nr:hypothetical protein [Pseudoxanthomonas mexicana]UOV05977.1 hypothetical protein MUU75_04595 [Pseudoxanthomonas mexicana]
MSSNLRPQAFGILRLDDVESDGKQGRPISVGSDRLMALSVQAEPLWFGFVVAGEGQKIMPGGEQHVGIAFLDEQGARKSFPLHVSILFGNGICSRGTLVLDRYAD